MSLPVNVLKDFPKLSNSNAVRTSDKSERYNCASYVVGDTRRRWWPDDPVRYWPDDSPDTIQSFIDLFDTLGFVVCESPVFEAGIEKIALYATDDGPQHVALQRTDRGGRWRSKLGIGIDIEHDLEDLEGKLYGRTWMFFKRPKRRGKSKRPNRNLRE